MTLAEMLNAANSVSSNIEIKNTEYTPLPAGEYIVAVTSSTGPFASKRANPNNPNEFGQFLKLEFTVIEGQYANRKLWMNNNILVYPKSSSEDDIRKAQTSIAMGAKEREVILASLGKTAITAAEELIGATIKVKVVVVKDAFKEDGSMKNEIKAILPANAATPSPSIATTTPKTTTTAKAKMPWEK